jgi:hypothetical protein
MISKHRSGLVASSSMRWKAGRRLGSRLVARCRKFSHREFDMILTHAELLFGKVALADPGT